MASSTGRMSLTASQGASPAEVLIECCRTNNIDLFHSTIETLRKTFHSPEALAEHLNSIKTPIGLYLLHVCSQYRSPTVLDALLDVEGLECDPIYAREGDTPLHAAIRAVNQAGDEEDKEEATACVDMLVDAGCDLKIKNKGGMRPVDLVDPRNEELKASLRNAQWTAMAGTDIVNMDEEDEGPTGSASDSE